MSPPPPPDARVFEDKAFVVLIVAVSLLFGWILSPLSGSILWGTVIATVFAPLQRRLAHTAAGRRTLAAFATLLIIVVMVILPVTVVTALLVDEASGVYETIRSRDWNVGRTFQQIVDSLPAWAGFVLGPLVAAMFIAAWDIVSPSSEARRSDH